MCKCVWGGGEGVRACVAAKYQILLSLASLDLRRIFSHAAAFLVGSAKRRPSRILTLSQMVIVFHYGTFDIAVRFPVQFFKVMDVDRNNFFFSFIS